MWPFNPETARKPGASPYDEGTCKLREATSLYLEEFPLVFDGSRHWSLMFQHSAHSELPHLSGREVHSGIGRLGFSAVRQERKPRVSPAVLPGCAGSFASTVKVAPSRSSSPAPVDVSEFPQSFFDPAQPIKC